MHAERRDVVLLSGPSASDAVNGLMRTVSALVRDAGYTPHFVDSSRMTQDDWGALVRFLIGGSVAFAVAFLGMGNDVQMKRKDSDSTVNVWEHSGVPLIKLHGDSPAYFLARHGDEPRNGVNTYYFDEHLAFRRWMLPDARSLGVGIDPFIISDAPLSEVDFGERERGTLVFVKNGGDARELMTLWAQKLPESISDELISLALEIAQPALQSGPFSIHGFVTSRLEAARIAPESLRQVVRLYTAQLDDYVRRLKSTMIAETLLRFPVVIQGAHWDHLDVAGARARIAPPLDFASTERIYRQELGVIDMTPNTDTGGHDRMWRAAGAYAFGLTNKSTWLRSIAPELDARAFEFEPESIAQSVEYALAHRADCIALARTYAAAFRKRYDSTAWVERLAALADAARLQHDGVRPALQPYFIW